MRVFNKKIYFFIGTTAELIKLAPTIKAIKKKKLPFKIITSGQTKIDFLSLKGYFGQIEPDIVFSGKVQRSSMFLFGWWAVKTFFSALFILGKEFKGLNKNNSYFIVLGDPVSTTIGIVIAWIYGLKIVHLESGDMTFNFLEPFPEEISRHINVRLADILFPPNSWALNNLSNINKIKINTKYNPLIEIFWWVMGRKVKNPFKGNKYYILILHRQEHVFFRKAWSKKVLEEVIKNADPRLTCVYFDYPITVDLIESLKQTNKIPRRKLKIMPSVSYPEFLKLLQNAEFIATDGATNQLESYLLGKPCLVLRDHTEQYEGLGQNVVLSTSNPDKIRDFLKNYRSFRTKSIHSSVKPSKIVLDTILKY